MGTTGKIKPDGSVKSGLGMGILAVYCYSEQAEELQKYKMGFRHSYASMFEPHFS
jgi:hypothetical protein